MLAIGIIPSNKPLSLLLTGDPRHMGSWVGVDLFNTLELESKELLEW